MIPSRTIIAIGSGGPPISLGIMHWNGCPLVQKEGRWVQQIEAIRNTSDEIFAYEVVFNDGVAIRLKAQWHVEMPGSVVTHDKGGIPYKISWAGGEWEFGGDQIFSEREVDLAAGSPYRELDRRMSALEKEESAPEADEPGADFQVGDVVFSPVEEGWKLDRGGGTWWILTHEQARTFARVVNPGRDPESMVEWKAELTYGDYGPSLSSSRSKAEAEIRECMSLGPEDEIDWSKVRLTARTVTPWRWQAGRVVDDEVALPAGSVDAIASLAVRRRKEVESSGAGCSCIEIELSQNRFSPYDPQWRNPLEQQLIATLGWEGWEAETWVPTEGDRRAPKVVLYAETRYAYDGAKLPRADE